MPVSLEHLPLFTFIKYLEMDSNKLNKKKYQQFVSFARTKTFPHNKLAPAMMHSKLEKITKNCPNVKRKFELRGCIVCRRTAYKCQVQTNIIVLCGKKKTRCCRNDSLKRQNVGKFDCNTKFDRKLSRN